MAIEALKFSNYTPAELVGMYVLNTTESGFSRTERKSIRKIKSATKTQFKIEQSDTSFDINSGYKKGSNAWEAVGNCILISDEDADKIRGIWRAKRERLAKENEVVKKITESQLTVEKLEEILLLIANS